MGGHRDWRTTRNYMATRCRRRRRDFVRARHRHTVPTLGLLPCVKTTMPRFS